MQGPQFFQMKVDLASGMTLQAINFTSNFTCTQKDLISVDLRTSGMHFQNNRKLIFGFIQHMVLTP